MSKEALIRTMSTEIDRLNGKIDLKIIKGRPYKKESRRHKFLLVQLYKLSSFSYGRS